MTYLEGNAGIVESYFERQLGKKLRVAFFGDHYFSDVHYSGTFTRRHQADEGPNE